jgi:hypothetical protein
MEAASPTTNLMKKEKVLMDIGWQSFYNFTYHNLASKSLAFLELI